MDNEKVAREIVKMAKELSARFEADLVALIDDRGKVVKREGKAVEGVGIFDGRKREYAGGFDADGIAYGSEVDSDNTILLFDGTRSKFKVGKKYRVARAKKSDDSTVEEVEEVEPQGSTPVKQRKKKAAVNREIQTNADLISDVQEFVERDAKKWPELSGRMAQTNLKRASKFLALARTELYYAWDNRIK